MDLKMYLRNEFAMYIRPLFIKDKCEICGVAEGLHLHHNIQFSEMLKMSLDMLGLDFNENIEYYNNYELDSISSTMLGIQIKSDYTTVCSKCHKDMHSNGNLIFTFSNRRNKYRIIDGNFEIPDNFLNRKLSSEDKKYLVDMFGTVEPGCRNLTFKSLCNQLLDQDYIVDITNRGIYIYKNKDDYSNRSNKSKVEKRINKLIEFLIKHKDTFIDNKEITAFSKIVNLKNSDGTIYSKPKKINEYLSSVGIKYVILNKPSHGMRRWFIKECE